MVGTSHDSVPVAKDPVLAGQSQRDLHLLGFCVTEFVHPEWPPVAKSTTLFCWGWWLYGPENSMFYLVFSFMVGFMGVQCLSNRPPQKNTHQKRKTTEQQDFMARHFRSNPKIFSWILVRPLTLTMAWWHATWSSGFVLALISGNLSRCEFAAMSCSSPIWLMVGIPPIKSVHLGMVDPIALPRLDVPPSGGSPIGNQKNALNHLI